MSEAGLFHNHQFLTNMLYCIMLLNLLLLLTLILLTWTIWRAPTNASKWRMGFNSAFKGLNESNCFTRVEIIRR
jgi:hypothetical protein